MNPETSPPRSPGKKWPLSRRTTLFVIGGLVLAIILVAIAVILTSKKDNSNTNTAATTYDRPGYDRGKLGSAFADPFAVTFATNKSAINYKQNKVVQACNILPLSDLTSQDILIKANTLPTPISRVVHDGEGAAEYPQQVFASFITGKSLGSDVNSCNYVLASDSGVPSITVNVFQPFAVPANVVDQEIQKNYTAAESIEGLQVFIKQTSARIPGDNDSTEYIVRQPGGSAFYLSLELGSDQSSKKQAILKMAAKNFTREHQAPSGIAKLEYKSPIFKKDIVKACDLIRNSDIRALSGRDASPLVREGIASSIGQLTFTGSSDKTPHLNIVNECTRSTVGGGSGLGGDGPGDLSLTVETTSFLSDTPAKTSIELQKKPNPNNRGSQALPSGVGDAGIAYTDATGGFHIAFIKGRILVDIKLDKRSQAISRVTSLSSAAEKMTPIAQDMAARIKLD